MKRYLITLGILLASCFFVQCGVFAPDDLPEGNSADAAPANQITSGKDMQFKATLTENLSEPLSHRYTHSHSYDMDIIKPTELGFRSISGTAECETGDTFKGVYFTLIRNGEVISTTDYHAYSKTYVSESVFPGSVPSGTYNVVAQAYGSGPCSFEKVFRFNSPDISDLLPDNDASKIDSALVGNWTFEGKKFSVPYRSELLFTSEKLLYEEIWVDEVYSLSMTSKVQVSVTHSPRRIQLTTRHVDYAANPNDAPSVNSKLLCIYRTDHIDDDSGLPVQLFLHCSEPLAGQFPQNFPEDPMIYYREGSSPILLPEFDEIVEHSNINLAIPDFDTNGVTFNLLAGKPNSTIVNASIHIEIEHEYIGDLSIILEHPDGSEFVLHKETGGATKNLNKTYGYSGTAVEGWEDLKGKPIDGNWKLKLYDNFSTDTGSLKYVRLKIGGRN